jgi:hypothetical protein
MAIDVPHGERQGQRVTGDRWHTFTSRRVLDASCKARLVKTKTVHSVGSEALGSMYNMQEAECDAHDWRSVSGTWVRRQKRTKARINIEVGFHGVGWVAGLLKEE